MIGSTLSHFTITAKLGEGGMGEVYLAQDTKLGRQVALKILPQAVAGDPERLARFEREAKVLASLNHPHIAGIHQVEQAEGLHFLVMELADGETLQERIARGPIALNDALPMALQIADALEAAHELGIVHRDLKPANIKVTREGKVKVLDFGLAKALEEERPGADMANSPTLTAAATQAGIIMGTAAYMSPEQAAGQQADRRADIWSFGVVLAEMLSGRQQFTGETVSHVLAAVLQSQPDLQAMPSDVPPPILDLMEHCLRKQPKQRLQAIGDARVLIEDYLADPTAFRRSAAAAGTGAVAPSRWQRWVPWAVALIALLGAVGMALWPEPPAVAPATTRAYIPPPAGGEFNLGSDFPSPVAVSPDGRTLAFGVRGDDDVERLWIRELDDLEARPLTGTEGALYPFWSPDSKYIGFFAGGKLKKIEASGGPAMTLCEAPNGKGGSWSAAGVIVFAPSHNMTIHRVSAAGGEAVEVTQFDHEAGEDSHRHPRFLPDGGHFLFVARAGGGAGSNSRVKIGSLTGEASELMAATSNVEYAAGHLLYVFDQALMARPFDAENRTITGEAFPLAENIYVDMGAVLGSFSVSEAGTLAYQTGSPRESVQANLQWRSRAGDLLSEIGGLEAYSEVHLSPLGDQALVTKVDYESGNADLWLVDLERGLQTRFTFEASRDGYVAWSADGEKIAFSSNRSGHFELYAKSVSGGGAEQLLRTDEGTSYPGSWTPDGRTLLYQVNAGKSEDMFAWEVGSDSEPVALQPSPFNDTVPMISPDGRWLAWAGDDSGRWEIYVTGFPGGGRKWQISNGGDWPRWRSDGSEIYYLTADGILMATQVDGSGDTFRVGATAELFEIGSYDDGFDYDVAADGQSFLIVKRADQETDQEQRPITLVLNWQNDLRRP